MARSEHHQLAVVERTSPASSAGVHDTSMIPMRTTAPVGISSTSRITVSANGEPSRRRAARRPRRCPRHGRGGGSGVAQIDPRRVGDDGQGLEGHRFPFGRRSPRRGRRRGERRRRSGSKLRGANRVVTHALDVGDRQRGSIAADHLRRLAHVVIAPARATNAPNDTTPPAADARRRRVVSAMSP